MAGRIYLILLLQILASTSSSENDLAVVLLKTINEVTTLKNEVTTLKEEVTTLKNEVTTLKNEVTTLKEEVSALKCRNKTVKEEVQSKENALNRLSEPVLELNLTRTSPQLTTIWRVAALPGGEAVIYNYVSSNGTYQIIKINEKGLPVKHLYSCGRRYYIGGLLELGGDIFVVHINGTVVRVNPQFGSIVRVYHIKNVGDVIHRGSLSSNPALIVDKDLLLLVDLSKGEVFTYRLSTEQKVVRVTGLSRPQSVSYLYTQQAVYYVVCEWGTDTVSVYNASWSRVSTMGRSSNITLSSPYAAITSLEQTILVADTSNHRIIEYSKDGESIRHLISVPRPYALSISFPHLWVVLYDRKYKLYRYRIYKN